jgi:hypothetical protein
MKRTAIFLFSLFLGLASQAQDVNVTRTVFHWGDDSSWKAKNMDDGGWQTVSVKKTWADQNMNREYTYA